MERYDRYKDSGIEWIGEIPEHWIVAKIKYTSTLSGRIGWQGLTSNEYQSTGPYLITGVNFSDGSIDWESCVHIPEARWLEATQIQIENGDLLITKDGTVGKVAIVDNLKDKASLNSGVMLIRANLKSGIAYLNKYLFYLLQSDVFWSWFSEINSGNSTIIHLYQGSFENFSFPIPPLSEQYKISDFISCKTSEIDSLIWRTEKFIALLQEYRKSVITEAVTKGLDPNVPMKDSGVEWIGEIPKTWGVFRNKLLFKLRDERNTQPLSKVNLLSLYTDLGVVQHKDLTKTTGNKATNANGYKVVYPSDIVVNIILCWMGAIGVSAYSGVVSPAYDVYSAKRLINPKYYHYLFRTKQFGDECYLFGRGIMQMRWRVYSDQFLNIKVPCPDYSTQCLIVDYLDQKTSEIDSLIEKKKQLVEKLQEYRRSLISECVTGKVKVPGVE